MPLRSIGKQELLLDNDEGLDTSLCLVVAQLQSALHQGDKAIGSINRLKTCQERTFARHLLYLPMQTSHLKQALTAPVACKAVQILCSLSTDP